MGNVNTPHLLPSLDPTLPPSPTTLSAPPPPPLPNKTPPLQILFTLGLPLILGPRKTLTFFTRRPKWRGTAAYLAGILLILLRWPLVGFLVEGYGIFVLFGDFLGTLAGFVGNVPVVGGFLRGLLQRAGVGRGGGELPV